MEYPVDCKTPAERTEFLYRAQEKLRILHNQVTKWSDEGLTTKEYEALPTKIKERFVDIPKITEARRIEFVNREFEPRSIKISQAIVAQRAQLKASSKWDMDVGEL